MRERRLMLYGRHAECAALDGLLTGARRSRSGVLVLRGEPGVGKSALCDYAAQRAGTMPVLRGAGIESEVRLPFAALHQVLHPVLDRLDLLPAPQASALRGAFGSGPGRSGDQFLIAVAVLTLLSESAAGAGLLCLIDDAHWLDPASSAALVFVARRLQAEGIAMVFAAGDGEARAFRSLGLPGRQVSGLDDAAARELLAESAPALTDDVCHALVAGTAGNPLALLEVPSALTEDQLAGRATLPVPLVVGHHVEQLYLARVHRLSLVAQRFLLIAAAEGAGDLWTILRAGEHESALDEAERAGLVSVRDERLSFHHPLVRSAVYHGATFLARRSAHLALSAALGRPDDADRQAWHRAVAAVGPDAGLAAELEQSAIRIRARGGAAVAADALERAARLSTDDATAAARYVAAAGDAWQAGQWARVPALLDAAEPVAQPGAESARIWFLRGMLELRSGLPAAACRMLLRSAAEATGPSSLETLVHAGEAAALIGDPALAVEVERLAGRLPVGDALLVDLVSGWAGLTRDDWPARARRLAGVVAGLSRQDAPIRQMWAGRAAIHLGDVTAARACYGRAVALARNGGAVGVLPMLLDRLAFTDVLAGRPADAIADAAEGLELAGVLGLDSGIALISLALAAAWTGDEDACRVAAERAHELAAARQLRVLAAGADWALGLLDLGLGRPADALERLRALAPGGRSDHAVIRLWATPDLAEAAVRAGAPSQCAPSVAGLERWAAGCGQRGPDAAVRRCRALLTDGDPAAMFQAALDLQPNGERPLERARTELLLGEALRRGRHPSESRVHLRIALEAFDHAGAAPWAARAGAELRASGETATQLRPVGDPLTPQERQIARFAGAGESNPDIAAKLFLSRRTVEYHLHKVFTKLGLASRAELAGLDLDNR